MDDLKFSRRMFLKSTGGAAAAVGAAVVPAVAEAAVPASATSTTLAYPKRKCPQIPILIG